MLSPHTSRGGVSSHESHGIAGDSQNTSSIGNTGLTRTEGLYRTFTPSNAGWSLQDFAWDKQAHRVASREDISAAQRERSERYCGGAIPVTYPGSAGRALHASRPVHPLAPAKLAARGKAWGQPGRLASRTEGTSSGKAQPSSWGKTSSVSPAPESRSARGTFPNVASGDDGSVGSAEGSAMLENELEAARGAEPSPSACKSGKKSSKICPAAETDSNLPGHNAFSRRCAVTLCEGMCQPSSRRRVERVLCEEHAAMGDVLVENKLHRFCQVCYALHPTSAFKNTNRTCSAVLARKRALRIQRQKKRAGAVHGEEGEDAAEAEKTPEVSAPPARGTKPAKPARPARPAGAEGRGARARFSSEANATRPTFTTLTTDDLMPAFGLLDAGHGGATGETEAAETSGGASTWLWSSLGLASGAAPAAKRARGSGPPISVAEETARNQMILDMEHGALGSAQITSAAIKIPHATPAYLSLAAGGTRAALPGVAAGSPDALPLPVHAGAHAQTRVGSDTAEHEMNALLQWMDQAPVRAPARRGEPHPAEDFGTDPFIRPGSLIYGAHSQGVVTDSACAVDDADDAHEPVSARTRHSSRSMLSALASQENSGGRLLRNAAASLRENALPAAAAPGAKDERRPTDFESPQGDSLDASGDGLLRVAEGVFGSFNGQICRLDVDPETGETVAALVKNTPYGFPETVLPGSASMLNSAAHSATLTLPFVPAPGTQMVCMFQGAHLPLLVETRADGATDVTVRFHPKGGYHAAAEWALNGGELTGNSYASPPVLEGTAFLEMLIAEGPMRGLPVGRVVPLLLSPDAELRREVANAMWCLEQDAAQRDTRQTSATGSASGVLPEPVALVSMLGAVLHAVGKNQEPNPRMYRGAEAMAAYFSLKRVKARLGKNVTTRGQIASPADIAAMIHTSMRAALTPHLFAFLAALVAVVCVTAYAKSKAGTSANADAWMGIAASAAAVAFSAWLVVFLARVTGLPERKKHRCMKRL